MCVWKLSPTWSQAHWRQAQALKLAPRALSITVTYQLLWWTITLSPGTQNRYPFSKIVSVIKDPYHPHCQRSLIAPMVEGSLVANLKNWARRSTRKERIVAKQSRLRRTSQHPTMTTDEAEQSQRTSSVAQHLATTVEVEQRRRTSSVSQSLAATAEAEKNQRESLVSPKIATAAETEQSQRTSFVA